MTTYEPIHVRGLQGVDLTVRLRIRDADRELVAPGDVAAVYLQIFDSTGQNLVNSPLVPSQLFFDTLQTGPEWTTDNVGYNFAATLSGDSINQPPGNYDVWFWCVPSAGGADFPLWFKVDLTPTQKVAYPA